MSSPTPASAVPTTPSPLEIEVYKSLSTLFNSEETSFWTRNNILVVVQGGLIAATASIVGNADKALGATATPRVALLWFIALCVLSAVGLLTAVAWAFMVGRSERIADVILGELKQLEIDLGAALPHPSQQAFNIFSQQLRRTSGTGVHRLNRFRLSKVWATLGGALAAVWLVLLVGFVTAMGSARMTPTPPPADPLATMLAAAVQQSSQAALAAAAAASAAQAAASAAAQAALAAQVAPTSRPAPAATATPSRATPRRPGTATPSRKPPPRP